VNCSGAAEFICENFIMFAASNRRMPVPAQSEENRFQFYFVIDQHHRDMESRVSKYFSCRDFLFRIMLYPVCIITKKGVAIYLHCGGPDTTRSDKKKSRKWSCAVRWRFILLHPSKWAALNIDPNTDKSGLLPSNLVIPPSPRDHVTNHDNIFQDDDFAGTGRANWAPYSLLQPGLFCDSKRTFVAVCQLNVHDYFNNGFNISFSL